MEQVALYREWRPQTFREVIGQEHVCRTLQNAVLMERTAHAYLFCGPRGTGKTSTARILAKALNCLDLKDGEPCNNCLSCRGITEGISLNVIEMDAASHRGIEEVRDLKQKVGMAPSGGRYKVYIVDEVHMLTGEAFNALLKTLEEPPAHAVFILATTEAHKVPLTILSRCQRFDFRRLGRPVIKEHLANVARAKNWSVEDEALELISRQVSGALRDALGLLDQAASFTKGQIRRKDIELLTGALGKGELDEIINAVAQGNVPGVLEQLDALFARGADPRQVLLQLADHVRELIFCQGADRKEQMFYARFLRGVAFAEGEMKGSSRPDLLLELALLRLTGAASTSGEGSLQKGAVSTLEKSAPQKRSKQAAGQTVREQAASAHPSRQGITQGVAQQRSTQRQTAVQKTREGKAKEVSSGERAVSLQQKVGIQKTEETSSSGEKVLRTQQKAADSEKTKEMLSPKKKPLPAADINLDLDAIHDFLISKTSNQPILAGVLPKCQLKRKGNSLLLLAPSFGCDLIRREENLKTLQVILQEYGCSLQLEVVRDETPSPAHVTTKRRQASSRDTLDNRSDNNSNSVSASAGNMGDASSETRAKTDHEFQGDQLLSVGLTLFNGKIIKRLKEGE